MKYVLVFFVCVWLYIYHFLMVDAINSPIFFRVSSLALGQSYDWPSVCEVTLNVMGKIHLYLTTENYNKVRNMRIIHGMYMYSTCAYLYPTVIDQRIL